MNKDVFRLVILILGLTIMSALGGIIFLAVVEKEIPGVLENLGVAALAGVVGLLARSPGAEETQNVNVVNPPHQPALVAEAAEEKF